jgi:hypothetical protein
MKKLVTILALTATVIASPALAKTHEHARMHAHPSGTYTLDGKVVSHDPDPYVRLEELRDAESGSADR